MKHIKDKSKLLGTTKLKAGKFYFNVFLWRKYKDFLEHTEWDASDNVVACCLLSPDIRNKLGEMHFVKGGWNLNIVAHEVCHAIIQRMRMAIPTFKDVINQETDSEEIICYNSGRWVDEVYNFLLEKDKPK